MGCEACAPAVPTDVSGCALPGVRHLRLRTLTPLHAKQPAVQLKGHLVACFHAFRLVLRFWQNESVQT